MTHTDRPGRPWRIAWPSATLLAVLAVALALALVPRGTTQPLRNAWREALRPGQQALTATVEWIDRRRIESRLGNETQLAQAEQQIADLKQQVQQQQLELLLAHSARTDAAALSNPSGDRTDRSQLPPLLLSQTVAARVLGRQAKAFLQARDLLDVGRAHGATAEALVIDEIRSGAVIDQGRDVAVVPGRLALAGSRVWGKVAEVGPHTSTIRRVTDAGFRDLVQLTTQHDGRLHFAARGVLVGRGEALCKIELVEATEPVTVGDLVFTTDDGVLDVPLLYGRVTRLERKPGAAHWEIWMEPAVAANSPPAQVAVLRMELNPARLAEASGQWAVGSGQ